MTDDDQLRRLLSDAVSDIEPQDRIAEIRASVHSDPKVVPMSRPRSWRVAVIGVAATVAVIGGVAFAAGALQGNDNADDQTPTGPVPSSTHTAPVTPPTTTTPTTPTTATPGEYAYAVYYLGDNPDGKPVLFREFHTGVGPASPAPAVHDLASPPLDPDYRTPWQPGDLRGATLSGGVIDVRLGSSSVHDRPAGMSPADARAAIQQVVYTVQAAFQQRLPVQFTWHGNPIDQVLGQPTSEPLSQGSVLGVCSRMSISNPNEGAQLSGKVRVSGVNNSFEASVVVYLLRDGSDKHLLVTPGMATGWQGDKLFPWTVHLDLSKVQPGQYTLVASNDDPSGQGHPEIDTRRITVG
jgi:Immunoglobulin-like domain of bacterial spore germination/Sporulation and spore germination